MFKALVVEDQNLMRLALMEELRVNLENCVVLGAETLEIALHELQHSSFDLIIVDPGLPGFDPIALADRITVIDRIMKASPGALYIVITGLDNSTEADMLCKRGIAAYLAKTGLEPGTLSNIIKDIKTTGFFTRLSRINMTIPDYSYSGLTPREHEIINMMIQRPSGTKRKEIYKKMADQLNIDLETVEKYYKHARGKLIKNGHKLPRGI